MERQGCRRWRSNPSGKFSQERLTRGTVTSEMRKAAHQETQTLCLNHFPRLPTLLDVVGSTQIWVAATLGPRVTKKKEHT